MVSLSRCSCWKSRSETYGVQQQGFALKEGDGVGLGPNSGDPHVTSTKYRGSFIRSLNMTAACRKVSRAELLLKMAVIFCLLSRSSLSVLQGLRGKHPVVSHFEEPGTESEPRQTAPKRNTDFYTTQPAIPLFAVVVSWKRLDKGSRLIAVDGEET